MCLLQSNALYQPFLLEISLTCTQSMIKTLRNIFPMAILVWRVKIRNVGDLFIYIFDFYVFFDMPGSSKGKKVRGKTKGKFRSGKESDSMWYQHLGKRELMEYQAISVH